MNPVQRSAAAAGLYDAQTAAGILKALASADIGGGPPLESTSVLWLAERLEAALIVASAAGREMAP